jgi:hypothetical protein
LPQSSYCCRLMRSVLPSQSGNAHVTEIKMPESELGGGGSV